MPPAYFLGGRALFELMVVMKDHFRSGGMPAEFATEVDLIIDEIRVARCDAALLMPDDEEGQAAATKFAGRRDPDRTRLLIPPTLIIESVSPGHELHDQRTKMRWYAEFGVPNYWILDAFARMLNCYALRESSYELNISGADQAELSPSAFPGLVIPLGRLWKPRQNEHGSHPHGTT